jgi:ribosomal protein S18 acetylase RimI-like enzyme
MEEGKLERIPVTIEVGSPGDLEALADLRYRSVTERDQKGTLILRPGQTFDQVTLDAGMREFRSTLEHSTDDEYFLVAKEGKDVVGMIGVFWRPAEKRFQLRRFYVRPDLQGKKIGSQLFRAAKERMQHSPHAPVGIFLRTDDYNEEAQEIYRGWGFKETESKDNWIRMDLDF